MAPVPAPRSSRSCWRRSPTAPRVDIASTSRSATDSCSGKASGCTTRHDGGGAVLPVAPPHPSHFLVIVSVAPPPSTGLLDQARIVVGTTLQPPAMFGFWNAVVANCESKLNAPVAVTPVVPIVHSGRRSVPSQVWPAFGPRDSVPLVYVSEIVWLARIVSVPSTRK